MDAQDNTLEMVHLIDRPAFCVSDGVIVSANQAAQNHFILPGQPIAPMVVGAQAEYAAFTSGLLYLTLQINGNDYGAAVDIVGPYHIFRLEQNPAGSELKALAVAAQALRIPLSSIMVMTDRLFPALQIPENSPTAEQMARINRGLAQVQRIISNMSDAARYSSDPPHLQTRDVDAVIRELFEQAAPLCQAQSVELSYSGLKSPTYSLIDSEQLERGIYNILSNALKFTPAGGSIQGALTRRGNTLYLTVQDSGSGIGPNGAGNVFDRFLREPALEDGRQGLGLGMKLIRSCASAHGGTVLLENAENQGLRLTMSLAIRLNSTNLRSPAMRIDYAGERNHGLMELSDSLPHSLYKPHQKN